MRFLCGKNQITLKIYGLGWIGEAIRETSWLLKEGIARDYWNELKFQIAQVGYHMELRWSDLNDARVYVSGRKYL